MGTSIGQASQGETVVSKHPFGVSLLALFFLLLPLIVGFIWGLLSEFGFVHDSSGGWAGLGYIAMGLQGVPVALILSIVVIVRSGKLRRTKRSFGYVLAVIVAVLSVSMVLLIVASGSWKLLFIVSWLFP